MAHPLVHFHYTNHRGDTAIRTVSVYGVSWLPEPGYGYEPGWFLDGWCHDKKAKRSFAWAKMTPHGDPAELHRLFLTY